MGIKKMKWSELLTTAKEISIAIFGMVESVEGKK